MNFKKLKEALDQELLPDGAKRHLVLQILSEDEKLIPDLLQILQFERERKSKLLTEMNFQLSRAHLGLEYATFKKKGVNGDRFMEKEITKFYIDHEDEIGHCFKDNSKLKESPQPNPSKFESL